MKKLVYLFIMTIGVVLTGCEPMEDIHEEVDATIDNSVVGNLEYILTEEDYTGDLDDGGLGLDFESFSSVDQANELLPDFLSDLYPSLGRGSIVQVTADIFNPAQVVEDIEEYTVTEEDYNALNFNYGNFDSADDMIRFLQYKYPDAAAGDAVELTYEYYAGETNTRTTTYAFASGSWMEAVTLEREDYTDMGESYPNFSSRGEAVSDLSTFLGLNYPYAQEGDEMVVLYDLYSGGQTNTVVDVFTYNGSAWTASGELRQETLQFGHNGEAWEPDNTIVYELRDPVDYVFIGNALIEEYPGPADNVREFQSFERRESDPEFWSDEMLYEGLALLLDEIAPTAEEGQKYVVTITTYAGGYGTESFGLIKENGEWVPNEL